MELANLEIVRLGVLAAVLCAALYTDLRFGKIYNNVTMPGMVIGLTLGAFSGWIALLLSLGGVALILALYLFFAPAVGIGGGDTKLLMAVGALLGLKMTVWALLATAIIGGVLALLVTARHKAALSTTRNMATNMLLKTAFNAPVNLASGSKGIKFKYSPAICIGTALAYLLRHP